MPTTKVTFSGDDADLLSAVNDITAKLKELRTATDEAKRGMSDFGSDTSSATDGIGKIAEASGAASNGVVGMIDSMRSAYSAYQTFMGPLQQAYSIADNFNAIGVASLRAKAGLDAMSGGKADEYITRMVEVTNGLVDDTDLMTIATKALSTGAAKTSDDLARLAKDGAILGLTFKQSADDGVSSLSTALQSVGNYRSLKQLGIDAADVRAEFGRLSQTMEKTDAWQKSVMDAADARAEKLNGSLDGVGTHWERLKIAAGNAFETMAEGFAQTLDDALTTAERIGKIYDAFKMLNGLSQKNGMGDQSTYVQRQTAEGIQNNPFLEKMQGKVGLGKEGIGFAYMGMSPEEYFTQLSGYQYGDNARYTSSRSAGRTDMSRDTSVSANAPYDAQAAVMAAYSGNKGRSNYSSEILTGELKVENDKLVARERLNDLIKFGVNFTQTEVGSAKELVANWQNAALAADAAAKAKKNMTTDQAFGVQGSSAIEGQGAGQLSQGLAAARAAQYAELQKKYGTPGADQRIQAFDEQSKSAMDRYAVATGAATNESLKFRDLQAALAANMAAGKITADQYATAMLNLARNTENGATSMSKLLTAEVQVSDQAASGNKTKSGMRDRGLGGADLSKITANSDPDNKGMQDAVQAEIDKAAKVRDASVALNEQASKWAAVAEKSALSAAAMDKVNAAYATYKKLAGDGGDFAGRKTPEGSEKAYDPLSSVSVSKYAGGTPDRGFGGADMSKVDTSKLGAIADVVKNTGTGISAIKDGLITLPDTISTPLTQAAKAFEPFNKALKDNISLAQMLLNTNGNVFITVNSSSGSGGAGGGRAARAAAAAQ